MTGAEVLPSLEYAEGATLRNSGEKASIVRPDLRPATLVTDILERIM